MPPTKIEIEGVKSGSRLSVRENEMVELKCVVHNAKPKATIVWFRENVEFYSGKQNTHFHFDLLALLVVVLRDNSHYDDNLPKNVQLHCNIIAIELQLLLYYCLKV